MSDRLLDLRGILTDLQKSGRIGQDAVNRVLGSSRTREESALHPVTYLGSQQLPDALRLGKTLDELALTAWLSEQSGLPLFHIDPMKLQVAALADVMSYAFAKRHDLLCVKITADELTVAVGQPYKRDWEDQLHQVSRRKIVRVLAVPSEIERYRVEFYSLARSISGASGGAARPSGVANFEQLLELGNMKDPEANDQHIVNIVDWLLQYAFDQRASDIHIEPRREMARMRFRIDGLLHSIYEFPANIATAIISRIKILGRMNVAEKRKPQDGRLKTKNSDGAEAELRLSTMPTAFGEKLVMRVFDPEVLMRSFDDLGLIGEDFKRWHGMMESPHGILLVTGPTGSGKTTTLYSSLKTLSTDEVNVSTIEDPIEMVEEGFNQTQVQHNIGLDFAAGIRTLMRQDPDIIMVGEIRDLETAQMAVQAALTGHLVLSTLHTNDAPTSISRLLDLGIPAYLLKATVVGVMAQRLVRTLCKHCRVKTEVDPQDWESLVRPWKVNRPEFIYSAGGCLECRNTGYMGRQGIYEIMPLTESLQRNIHDDTDLNTLRQHAMREGMRTLRLSGAQKVAAGLTTVEEVLRVAPAVEKYQ
ncbi:MAG: GspE/PulE family protein [Cellvibrionaceae bacterium]|nr:GspE/PulE family protein [Cellvibrionaceae bacterium]